MGSIATSNEGLLTLDDLIRRRAENSFNKPLVAYPASPKGLTDFELLTGADLNCLVDAAAKHLISIGIKPVVSLHRFPSPTPPHPQLNLLNFPTV